MIKYKSHIAFFLFVAFLLIRVVNLHAISHIDDTDSGQVHCELCDIIHHSHKDTQFLAHFPDLTDEFNFFFHSNSEVYIGYNEPLHQIATPLELHNKPPPTQL